MNYLVMNYQESIDLDYSKLHNDVIRCCLKSFRFHNQTAQIVLFTGKRDLLNDFENYSYRTIEDSSTPWNQKYRILLEMANVTHEGDPIIWCDIDMIFLDDPFSLDWRRLGTMDMGCSSRLLPYKYSATSAFLALVNTEKSRKILRDIDSYIPTMNPRLKDMEYACHLLDTKRISDLGWYWDFCPGREFFKKVCYAEMYRRAIQSRSVGCVHLKADAKYMIYNTEFQNLPELTWM